MLQCKGVNEVIGINMTELKIERIVNPNWIPTESEDIETKPISHKNLPNLCQIELKPQSKKRNFCLCCACIRDQSGEHEIAGQPIMLKEYYEVKIVRFVNRNISN